MVMIVREHTEQFYKVSLRASYVEDNQEKKKSYINGLRLDIQDETNIIYPRTIEEAYQCGLNAK